MITRYGVKSGEVYDLGRVQKQLPADAALVAWVDLPFVPNWHEAKGDHWACVVRSTGEPVWVQLEGTGLDGAWTTDDEKLAVKARGAFATRSDDPKAEWKDLAGKLAKQRLTPLEPHLVGIKHLIILPSVGMTGVPVEVLTERTVSYAPSGTMFAWLRERRPAAAKPARLLLSLGDPAGGGDRGPAPLPGSRQELAGISRVFDECREFKGDQASELSLERVAAEEGGLKRFPYLHFATHGVLDDKRPMRSALLLAQDRPAGPAARGSERSAASGGRLTAERMMRQWKLDAELVTLSACRTGLGKYAGGDGYLGFSQALFVAGARSLVLSLWEVDDTATALLMTRFYENLMGLPAQVPGGPVAAKPTKAEALAEAKQWLRTLSPADVDVLRKDLPRQGTRGEIVKKAGIVKAPPSYAHPYYWSGFVLVGDPK
jgi:CHAT domain-containing protein